MDLESQAAASPSIALPTMDRPTLAERAVAALEVIACSDFPTQFLVMQLLLAIGLLPQNADGTLNFQFVVWISLIDTVMLIGLIGLLLRLHGESRREVFLGDRPILAEAKIGLPMTLVAFGIAVVVLLSLRWLVPQLHTTPENPFRDLMRTPVDAVVFAVVVVVAGGVREELQRAFLMRRFERYLGGAGVGVLVASAAFGAGHWLQGADAAVATAILGAFWAVVYLRRRSVVAPVVSHSGFNILELVQFLALRR